MPARPTGRRPLPVLLHTTGHAGPHPAVRQVELTRTSLPLASSSNTAGLISSSCSSAQQSTLRASFSPASRQVLFHFTSRYASRPSRCEEDLHLMPSACATPTKRGTRLGVLFDYSAINAGRCSGFSLLRRRRLPVELAILAEEVRPVPSSASRSAAGNSSSTGAGGGISVSNCRLR